MTKRWVVLYRILVVLVALYGVMSACICVDHTSLSGAKSVCHCAAANVDFTGVQVASHHQCCGMERAPMVVDDSFSSSPPVMGEYVLVHPVKLPSVVGFDLSGVSTSFHAPPGAIPIYFTTQRFLI